MPPRSNPTARQERLGAELRKLREAAGITAREAARLVGTDPMQISHMEAGRVGVSEDRLRRLADQYACMDGKLVDALVAMANERGKGWWEEYRGVLPHNFLDLSELEHHAVAMRILQVVHMGYRRNCLTCSDVSLEENAWSTGTPSSEVDLTGFVSVESITRTGRVLAGQRITSVAPHPRLNADRGTRTGNLRLWTSGAVPE